MRIAISNIAWPTANDSDVAEALVAQGISAIEIAPTKIWPDPRHATEAQIRSYRGFWETRGISIVASQALLFGRPELTLFESAETRVRTLEYLRSIVSVCGQLGAKAQVFGSPKNRRTQGRDRASVLGEAVDFFGKLAESATAADTVVVLEANPPDYGADFITRAGEAIELVRAVKHPGLRLHLDSACMTLAGDDPADVMPQAVDILAHYHVSEPHLVMIGQGGVDHARFAAPLAESRYPGWLSIEMRQPEPFDVRQLMQAIDFVKKHYAPTL